MQKSNAPVQFTVPFANGATSPYRNVIPIAASGTPGIASYTTGFPPITMQPVGSGGIPPYGADMNGILYASTLAQLWAQAGYVYNYSSSVSTALGGYPAQAAQAMASGLGLWLSTQDNNTTNPDATGATGWLALYGNAGKTTMNVTGGTFTPDPSVLGVPLMVLTGTLTSNLNLVLPLTAGASWKILNSTSGSFAVNAGGSTGSVVAIAQGQLIEVTCDGTNYNAGSVPGGPFLPLTGTAVAATKLATARTLAMTGPVTWSVSFDGSTNVSGAAAIAAGAVTLAMMANLTANTLLGNPTGSAATPVAVPLVNGLIFTSGSLGLGNITPNTVATGVTTVTTTGPSGLTVSSSSTNSSTIQIANTASGGRTYSIGSFNSTGAGFTALGFWDNTAGALLGSWVTSGFTVAGSVTFSGVVQSSTTTCILAPNGAGAIYLRPQGSGSSTGQLFIDSSGNTTVAGTLNVNSSITASGNLNAAGALFTASGSECDVHINYGGSGAFGYYLSTNSTGFGINIKNGSGSYAASPLTINTSSGQVNVNTQLNVSGNINKTSDLTLKDVIDYPEPRQLAEVGLVRYRFLEDPTGQVYVGLPAQGIQEIAPEHVGVHPDTGKLNMDYSSVAVEQSWRNAADIRQLRAEFEALKQRGH